MIDVIVLFIFFIAFVFLLRIIFHVFIQIFVFAIAGALFPFFMNYIFGPFPTDTTTILSFAFLALIIYFLWLLSKLIYNFLSILESKKGGKE